MLQATTPVGETGEEHALNSYNDWRARANQDAIISWEVISSSNCPSQRELSKRVQNATQRRLPIGDERTKALRSSLRVLGAKGWLKAQPSPSLENHKQDRNFRSWFKFYCRMALFNGNETCPRKGCHAVLDQYGDHLLHCPNGMHHSSSTRIWRHNSQVRLLGSDLRKAAL